MKIIKLIKLIFKKIANIQSILILTICFFTITPLFALLVKFIYKEDKLSWKAWSMPSNTLEDLKRQY